MAIDYSKYFTGEEFEYADTGSTLQEAAGAYEGQYAKYAELYPIGADAPGMDQLLYNDAFLKDLQDVYNIGDEGIFQTWDKEGGIPTSLGDFITDLEHEYEITFPDRVSIAQQYMKSDTSIGTKLHSKYTERFMEWAEEYLQAVSPGIATEGMWAGADQWEEGDDNNMKSRLYDNAAYQAVYDQLWTGDEATRSAFKTQDYFDEQVDWSIGPFGEDTSGTQEAQWASDIAGRRGTIETLGGGYEQSKADVATLGEAYGHTLTGERTKFGASGLEAAGGYETKLGDIESEYQEGSQALQLARSGKWGDIGSQMMGYRTTDIGAAEDIYAKRFGEGGMLDTYLQGIEDLTYPDQP